MQHFLSQTFAVYCLAFPLQRPRTSASLEELRACYLLLSRRWKLYQHGMPTKAYWHPTVPYSGTQEKDGKDSCVAGKGGVALTRTVRPTRFFCVLKNSAYLKVKAFAQYLRENGRASQVASSPHLTVSQVATCCSTPRATKSPGRWV